MADISQGLSLQMSQRMEMVMTPQMIQSMEMLQLPIMALEQRIQTELMENPALELTEMKEDGDEAEAAAGFDEDEAAPPLDEPAPETSVDLRSVDELDYDWDGYYEDGSPRRRSAGEDDEEYDPIESAADTPDSFREYLVGQLSNLELNPRERQICERIIYSLEDSGYLLTPLLETIDPELQPSATPEELEAALLAVQSLEPAGVGARGVKECLLLQIDALGDHDFERRLIENHLEDLAANRLPQIARGLGCTLEDVKDAATFIRSLNPHPGHAYNPGEPPLIRPDAICEPDERGGFEVRLPGGSQPDVSDLYLALFDTTKRGRQLRDRLLADPERADGFKQMQAAVRGGETGKLLREKYQAARWLITAIAQRERTLLRVATEIVKAQTDYLAGRSDAPAPLMMQEVADRVGVDISTVSRAVREKYLDTPRGLKPLRMFFTRAVGGSTVSTPENSNAQIKNRLRELIEAEDRRHPLKDDQLQEMLLKEGIDIKRRTVAKYRADLGFPAHSQRREY